MFYVLFFLYSDMHRDQCGEMYEGLCQKMTSINGEVLLKFLRNVSFKGTSFMLKSVFSEIRVRMRTRVQVVSRQKKQASDWVIYLVYQLGPVFRQETT